MEKSFVKWAPDDGYTSGILVSIEQDGKHRAGIPGFVNLRSTKKLPP